jgi:hypothetical protein
LYRGFLQDVGDTSFLRKKLLLLIGVAAFSRRAGKQELGISNFEVELAWR